MIDLNDYEECEDRHALVRGSVMHHHRLWWHDRIGMFMDAVQDRIGGG